MSAAQSVLSSPLSLIELCRHTSLHTLVRLVRNADMWICAEYTTAYNRREFFNAVSRIIKKKRFDFENWNIFFCLVIFCWEQKVKGNKCSITEVVGGQRWRGLITQMRICDAVTLCECLEGCGLEVKVTFNTLKKHLNIQTNLLSLPVGVTDTFFHIFILFSCIQLQYLCLFFVVLESLNWFDVL